LFNTPGHLEGVGSVCDQSRGSFETGASASGRTKEGVPVDVQKKPDFRQERQAGVEGEETLLGSDTIRTARQGWEATQLKRSQECSDAVKSTRQKIGLQESQVGIGRVKI
jgi:hypothetical protein